MDQTRQTSEDAPFVGASVGEAFSLGLRAMRTHDRVWARVYASLVLVRASLNLVPAWLGREAVVAVFGTAAVIVAIGYVAPTVWAAQLGRPLDKRALTALRNARRRNVLNACRIVDLLLLGLSITALTSGLWVLSELSVLLALLFIGRPFLFIPVALLVVAGLARIGAALLIVAPTAVVERLGWRVATRRAWRLSRPSLGLLSLIVITGVSIHLTVAVGWFMVDVRDRIPQWMDLIVVAPLWSSLLNLWWLVTGGPAYAIARHSVDGYSASTARRDFEALLHGTDTAEHPPH